MRATTQEFQQRIGRIEGLVQKLESASDPSVRKQVRELLESLMELHGAAFERVLEIVSGAPGVGTELVQSLAGDELIGSLLVLYNLHPEDFETRVRRGIDNARPLLRSHGVRIDHISIAGNSVRLKLVGDGPADLEAAVRDAMLATAPDAEDLSIEGLKAPGAAAGFVPLSSLLTSTAGAGRS